MKVLVACERSGTVRDAFRAKGHDAWSCDLLPTESPEKGYHLEGDVLWWIYGQNAMKWDLMIAHPPCQYLARCGARWWKGREKEQSQALGFVHNLMDAPIPKICIENPPGRIGTAIQKADQYIQPWQFGHDASKKTGLWLKGLPCLVPTKLIHKARYANQTPSGQNNLGPSKDRAKIRSLTYAGIAEAMADQWGTSQKEGDR